MKKVIRASAFALATIGLLSTVSVAVAQDSTDSALEHAQMSASVDIGRIRSVLKLTPDQQAYWPPVEAALRTLARRQTRAEPDGFVRRIGSRVVSVVLSGAAIERLAVAARPLIAVLNDDQMRAAGHMAQEMGLGPVVMAALK